MVTSTRSQPAKKGDSTLHVVSTVGFKIGDRLKIGDDSLCEYHVLNGWGSLSIFPATLRGDYETGATVTVDQSDDDEATYADVDATRSDGSVEIRTNQTPAKIATTPLPKYRTELDAYHIAVVGSVLVVSTRIDNKEK